MNLAIDESGSFTYTDAKSSWNCVVAYTYPEVDTRKLRKIVQRLVSANADSGRQEVKLRDLEEDAYLGFLGELAALNGIAHCVAVDASMNTGDVVDAHQQGQMEKLLAPVDLMYYDSMKQSIREMAAKVGDLSPQLYVQLVAQTELVRRVLHSSILFFVQRFPATLGKFRWKIDQKNASLTDYEDVFRTLLPAFLQTASFRDPLPMIKGSDYSHFANYYFPEGEEPTYLKDFYGIDLGDDDEGRQIDVGRVVSGDAAFVDSRSDAGVQVADLLASGIRRCLRSGFERDEEIAKALGSVLVENDDRQVPVHLIALGDPADEQVPSDVVARLNAMRSAARPMLTS
jgi:hypothetical protein